MTVMDRFTQRLGDPAEALKRQQQMNTDLEYFLSNVDAWREQFPDQWVAVRDKQLVAVAVDHTAVLAALDKKGLAASGTLIRFVTREPVFHLL